MKTKLHEKYSVIGGVCVIALSFFLPYLTVEMGPGTLVIATGYLVPKWVMLQITNIYLLSNVCIRIILEILCHMYASYLFL